MNSNSRAVPSTGPGMSAVSSLADGFGGPEVVLRNCCPVETLPVVRGRELPSIAPARKARVYGSIGQDGAPAHGAGEFSCQTASCKFKTRSPRDLSEHYARGGHE